MSRKLIFLDIDGTLTVPGTNVPPESARKAVRLAREKGNLVYLCTGRNYDMLSPVLQYGFDGVIASAGAYIMCGEEVIYDCPMTRDEQTQVMEVLQKEGIFRTIECLDGSYTDEGFKEFLEAHAGEGENSELLRWRRQIEGDLNIQPMAQYHGQPIYKTVVMAQDMEQLKRAQQALREGYHFCIQDPDKYGIVNGEILKKEYDKGIGVERVCERLGIPLTDTIAFGDSMNDLEMLEKVHLAICMENGSTKLKELADEICPAVEADGLYLTFQKYHII